jgi:HemY protein
MTAAPLFRARSDIPKDNAKDNLKDAAKETTKTAPAGILPVIPIIRAPDDPGIDDEADEFAEQTHSPNGQAGGWRGFLTRWGN